MSSDLYSRLVDDPGFRQRVEAQYGGDEDLLDVAWWLEHPEEDTPGGRAAPAHAIRALQHQVYARSTSEEDRHNAAEALRVLQEHVAASRAQLVEAVAGTEARAAPMGSASPDVEAAHPRTWWPAAAVGAAVIIAATGFSAGLAVANSSSRQAANPLATALLPAPVPVIVSQFDQPQAAEDIPAWIPAGFRAGTFRRVAMQDSVDAQTFVVRDEANMICLVMIAGPDRAFFSSCALESDIAARGLGVQYRENGTPAEGDPSVATERLVFAVLKRDGAINSGIQSTPIPR